MSILADGCHDVLMTCRAGLYVLGSTPPATNALALAVQGYQVFTQACGNLQLLQPRDAFLANLCEFALATAGPQQFGELDPSPRGAAGLPSAERMASPRGALAAASAAAEVGAEQGLVLAPKNVQSMRTLFNIAHRLSNVLGPAWALVLETMNTLDRILNSPRTTTQVGAGQSRCGNPGAWALVPCARGLSAVSCLRIPRMACGLVCMLEASLTVGFHCLFFAT